MEDTGVPGANFGKCHEYKVVAAPTAQALETAVATLMAAGWQLAGGVQWIPAYTDAWVQSMYRTNNWSLLKS